MPNTSVIIPTLVGKVPRRLVLSRLAHEARDYEEVVHFQDVTVPRYHGLFEVAGSVLFGWDEDMKPL